MPSVENPVRGHALREALELLVELGLLLLAHRPAQQVRGAEGVPGHLLRDGHDLLLVHDQAVRLAEDLRERLGQFGVDRHDRLAVVLPVGVLVVRVHPHRAGPVQGDDGGDVFEVVRSHLPQQRAQRPAVELEDTERVAAGEQVVGGLVVEVGRSSSTTVDRRGSP